MQDPLEPDRARMVEEQIKARGVSDQSVLRALLTVPRHEFVPEENQHEAYRDGPLPIGNGQTISQPYMVASMTEAARVEPGSRILEIGTGSGYQAAILAELGASVFTVERLELLSKRAQGILVSLGYTEIRFLVADGTLGWQSEAPFDAVVVTAGAPQLPEPLLEQLADGGRLVIPIEDGFSQVLYVVTKTGGETRRERKERCTFVPLIGKYGWDR
ncbi:MAG TPA: protein-L-isoaspartate(D-aspartate) O-methyltransferase [Acidobacteriota bacterium]|nr:protein-L-isoaspartate(D-aspartate) O-methyltransferase [Acidobacteriota bacterium]